MSRRPPISTLTDILFPYTTLFRSIAAICLTRNRSSGHGTPFLSCPELAPRQRLGLYRRNALPGRAGVERHPFLLALTLLEAAREARVVVEEFLVPEDDGEAVIHDHEETVLRRHSVGEGVTQGAAERLQPGNSEVG